MDKDNQHGDLKQGNEEMDWEAFFSDETDEAWERGKKRKNQRRKVALKIISSLLVVVMLISGLQIWFNLFNIPAIEFLQVSKRLSQNPEVREYKKSVVTIEWDGVKGTGFNINENGLIITNEHVVENTDRVNVYFHAGASYIGKVISKNPELDLAVIEIEAKNLPVLPLSFEENWEKSEGEKIIFIGNPLSFTQITNEGTIAGAVLLQDWDVPVMMIDAPVYRGNSGSPVLNQNGEVIGILFATISSPEGKNRVGVAIPAFYLKDLLEIQ